MVDGENYHSRSPLSILLSVKMTSLFLFFAGWEKNNNDEGNHATRSNTTYRVVVNKKERVEAEGRK